MNWIINLLCNIMQTEQSDWRWNWQTLSPRGDCRGGCCHHIFVFFPHFYEKTSKGDIRKNSWDALYLQFLRSDEISCLRFCADGWMRIWRFLIGTARICLLPSEIHRHGVGISRRHEKKCLGLRLKDLPQWHWKETLPEYTEGTTIHCGRRGERSFNLPAGENTFNAKSSRWQLTHSNKTGNLQLL